MADLLSGSLEENVLTILCWSDEHAPLVASKVPPDLFSTRTYQTLARLSIAHLTEFNRPPRAHLRDLLEEKLRQGDEGRFLSQVLDAMDSLAEEIQPEYVLPQLDRFISLSRATQINSKIADSLHSGSLEAAFEQIPEIEEVKRRFYEGEALPTASDLVREQLPPVSWVVNELIPEGVTMVVGPPKIGKSWLILDIAIAVASGRADVIGRKARRSGVLLFALEDNSRRLQSRINTITGDAALDLGRLRYQFEALILDAGFLGKLAHHLSTNPDIKLVIIDTLQFVRGSGRRTGEDSYTGDVRVMRMIKQFANKHGISIIVVHHNRKAKGDVTEMVSGTNGLAGTADTIMMMTRHTDDSGEKKLARLQVTGRDLVDEIDKLIELDPDRSKWQELGDYFEAAEPEKREGNRERIIEAIRANGGPMRFVDIAAEISRSPSMVSSYLTGMAREPNSPIVQPRRGVWDLRENGSATQQRIDEPLGFFREKEEIGAR